MRNFYETKKCFLPSVILIKDNTMTRTKYHPFALVFVTLCLFQLTQSAVIAGDQGKAFIQCTEISTDGIFYPGKLEKAGDVNAYSFDAQEGNTYVIETIQLNTADDTVIYLYNKDGAVEIDGYENIGTNLASQIVWTASASEIYFVMVERLDGKNGPISYNISIR